MWRLIRLGRTGFGLNGLKPPLYRWRHSESTFSYCGSFIAFSLDALCAVGEEQQADCAASYLTFEREVGAESRASRDFI